VYSYKTVDLSDINAMMNGEDVSEYLKLSSNGLEVCWSVDLQLRSNISCD